MIDFSSVDPTFIQFIFMILINVLTQVGKPFHKSPFQVFALVSFIMCFIYAIVVFSFGHAATINVLVQMGQIFLTAAGAWHVLMRPEGQLQLFLKKIK